MAIEDLGISLLDRQERLTEEERRRREEQRKKNRRRARREALTSAAVQGGVKIGNAILAERADNFFDKEWDMASRAKYKAAVAGRDDTQALWTNIRQTHDSSADWKLSQLRDTAKQHLKETVPDWDGKINEKLAAELKEKATTWGVDFDQKYEKSFEIEDYDKYADGLQKKFGRPKDIGSWVTRGIVDRVGGHSGAEARQARLSKLRSEIDGFDDKYGDMFKAADAEGTISQAIEAIESSSGSQRLGHVGFKTVGEQLFEVTRVKDDSAPGGTKMETKRLTNNAIIRSTANRVTATYYNDDGKLETHEIDTPPPKPLTAAQQKNKLSLEIQDIYKSRGNDHRANYEWLKENHNDLFMSAINKNVSIVKDFWDEDMKETAAKIKGGQSAINNQVNSLAANFKDRVNFEDTHALIRTFDGMGYTPEETENIVVKLQDFFNDGIGGDHQSFNNLVHQSIAVDLKDLNQSQVDPVELAHKAIIKTAARLIRIDDTSFFGKYTPFGRDKVVVGLGSDLSTQEQIERNTRMQVDSAQAKEAGVIKKASFSGIAPSNTVKQLKEDLSNMETQEERQQLLDGISTQFRKDYGTTITFSPEILNLVKGVDEGIDDGEDIDDEEDTDTRTESEIRLDQADKNTKNILGFLRDESVGEMSSQPEWYTRDEDPLEGFKSKRARSELQGTLSRYLFKNKMKFQPVKSPSVLKNWLKVQGAEFAGESERDVAAMKEEMARDVDIEMIDKAKDIFGNDYTDRDSYAGYFISNPQDLQLLIDSDWDMNKFIMAK